jgi:putative ABC transport system permease protein
MRTIREWIHRLVGTLRSRRADADLQEELRLHMELAAEDAQRRGESVRTARVRTGGATQAMDALRDQRGWPWLQSVCADVVFAWRQLNKHRTTTVAAVLSLGVAVGATTAAFRLLDAVFWRSLPIVQPERVFVLGWNTTTSRGEPEYRDDFDYPTFRRYRAAVEERAAVMLVGSSSRQEIVVDTEVERATRQHVSGNLFATLGLRPVVGRLIDPGDDVEPRGRDVVVISFDYWTRRFARDPAVVGRRLRWGRNTVEIIGVAPQGFTGTEPGRMADFFAPATLNVQALNSPGWSWFRIWVKPNDSTSPEHVRQLLQAQVKLDRQESVKLFPSDTPGPNIAAYLDEQIQLSSAATGVSGLQHTFRRPLFILAALVVLVLLIACANVANLLLAQGVARAQEMALRVSIGAGRWRLIQLVLVEGALLAVCAAIAGALFAWFAAPFVVSLLAFEEPVQLVLNANWRVLMFGVALTIAVTVLFGLAPALRASSVKPLGALKVRDDRHGHRRVVRSLVGAQMAFCLFVVFTAGLFAVTLRNLATRPLGFEPDRLAVLEINLSGEKQPPQIWDEVGQRIRATPGVESVAFAMWAPLSGNGWRAPVSTPGHVAGGDAPYFLGVSPAYFSTMQIGLLAGRDFRIGDTPPTRDGQRPVAGVGIVNEAFARAYFDGRNPIGRQVLVHQYKDGPRDPEVEAPMEIVGLVRDAAYRDLREPMRPTVFVPNESRNQAALMVRTSGDPAMLGLTLRRGVTQVRPDFRVTNVGTQSAFLQRQLLRERLLATLSLFFATVALVLAGIGLFGVLNYAVIQRRREIGIRMALGARAAHVVRRVTAELLTPVGAGVILGLAGGLAFGQLVQSILFEVKATDAMSVAMPLVTLGVAAALAALPPAVRAVRIDPAQTLRSE